LQKKALLRAENGVPLVLGGTPPTASIADTSLFSHGLELVAQDIPTMDSLVVAQQWSLIVMEIGFFVGLLQDAAVERRDDQREKQDKIPSGTFGSITVKVMRFVWCGDGSGVASGVGRVSEGPAKDSSCHNPTACG